MISYFANLSPVIAFVVAILIFFSLVSWAIIVFKLLQLRSVGKSSKEFLDFFWETKDFAAIETGSERFAGCPLAAVFEEGYRETKAALGSVSAAREGSLLRTDISGIDGVARKLRRIAVSESSRLEKNLSFLATAGSTSPFIGLFGTVWGIMTAFQQIGQTGSTSLDVVAPGISEALITTAIGLAVAIPAVIGFNYLQGRIKVLKDEIDGFSYDFIGVIQRIFETKLR
jgi:biopolymer transport protein TolQ